MARGYKKRKHSFHEESKGIKDTKMTLDRIISHDSNRVTWVSSTSCSGFSKQKQGFLSSKQIGALPRSQWPRFLES